MHDFYVISSLKLTTFILNFTFIPLLRNALVRAGKILMDGYILCPFIFSNFYWHD